MSESPTKEVGPGIQTRKQKQEIIKQTDAANRKAGRKSPGRSPQRIVEIIPEEQFQQMAQEEADVANRKASKKSPLKSPQQIVEIAPEEQFQELAQNEMQPQPGEKRMQKLQIDNHDDEVQIPLKKPRQSVKVRTYCNRDISVLSQI